MTEQDAVVEIVRFELNGESMLVDSKGKDVRVFMGEREVTEHVRHLRYNAKTGRLLF